VPRKGSVKLTITRRCRHVMVNFNLCHVLLSWVAHFPGGPWVGEASSSRLVAASRLAYPQPPNQLPPVRLSRSGRLNSPLSGRLTRRLITASLIGSLTALGPPHGSAQLPTSASSPSALGVVYVSAEGPSRPLRKLAELERRGDSEQPSISRSRKAQRAHRGW
jgi:hypothetical protein